MFSQSFLCLLADTDSGKENLAKLTNISQGEKQVALKER